ncbi:MAG TPA: ATP-dependent Clp protease adaptor ClpS [Planctomycetota bacterium]|nr:ATP-dependent Clp protease adaptor ClpS [Planctomycetota bacterium]
MHVQSQASGPSVATPGAKPATQHIPRVAPRYKVLIHNDAVTPMNFVVQVLVDIFRKAVPEAVEIMLEAHNGDVALVDVMGLEEAEFRVDQAHSFARGQKFPLTFTIEPE